MGQNPEGRARIEPFVVLGYHAEVISLLQEPSMDQLIGLPEKRAQRWFFDSRNCQVFFRQLFGFVLAALLLSLWLIAEERYLDLWVPLLNLILIRLLHLTVEHPFFTRHFPSLLLASLLTQYLFLRLMLPPQVGAFFDFLFPLLLLFYRLPRIALAIPLLVIWVFASREILLDADPSHLLAAPGDFALHTVLILVVFGLVSSWTEAQRLEFVERYRRESRRSRERRRMQEELGDARRIQLSLLPTRPPQIPWLDVAGVSIPASEVGGDYYGYFPVSENRFAVVVADVAGHGVASGLVLSAIRACLYLLHDESHQPTEILRKLDQVLRQTSGNRLLVTMLYVLFDAEEQTVTAAAAGHHPLLCYAASTGQVESLGTPTLPLGTNLPKNFEQHTRPMQAGDVFLLYTDGIAETANHGDEMYGLDRLSQRLSGLVHGRNAMEIRDTLLGDVVAFKSDREQTDDITVVVIRARPPRS